MANPNIDPTSGENVLSPTQQPTSPLLDFLIQSLAISPGHGWGGQEALVGLANVRRKLDENRARHLAALAGDAPIDYMPTELTPNRSPIGGLLQDIGILGPPGPRPLTAEEKFAVQYGAQQKAQQAALLQKMELAQQMGALQQIELAQRIAQMPVEQQRKLLNMLMGVSAEAGPEAAQQLAPSVGVTNLPAFGGKGAAQTRGLGTPPKGPTELQTKKSVRDDFNFSTKLLQDEIKSLKQERARTGLQFKKEKAERLKQLEIQLSQLANEWGLPPIMLPVEEPTPPPPGPNIFERAGGAVKGAVSGLFSGGEAAPPSGGGQAEAGPFEQPTATPTARPAMTPTPIVELPPGYTIRLKQKK